MHTSTQSIASPYSLFDADLPLLAVDAASELDQMLPTEAGKTTPVAQGLLSTSELLDRLISISSNNDCTNVDGIMYEQSFLPNMGEEQEMFSQPSNLKVRLDDLLTRHSLFVEDNEIAFLRKLRDFFLEVSSFASSSRRMLHRGGGLHPNATL
jgi:hypothetical protein